MTDSRPLRVAAVRYLNTRPLVHGLDSRRDLFTLQFEVPSRCAELLHDRSSDLAMLSAIEYLRQPDYWIVPDIAVASYGPVNSVALYSTRPMNEVKTIAIDSSSRTAVTLLHVLCARRYGIEPEFVTMRPSLEAMLERCDAALLIGDPALFARYESHVCKIDMGEEWTVMTGLPFVWCFWAGPRGPVLPDHVDALQSARCAGTSSLDAVADAHCSDDPDRAAVSRTYLRENLRFDLSEDGRAGLEMFFAAARDIGIIPSTTPAQLSFF